MKNKKFINENFQYSSYCNNCKLRQNYFTLLKNKEMTFGFFQFLITKSNAHYKFDFCLIRR